MAFVYTPEAQKMRRPPALSRLTKEHRNSWGHFSLKMNPDFSASDWLRNFRLKHPTQLYGRFSGFRLKCEKKFGVRKNGRSMRNFLRNF